MKNPFKNKLQEEAYIVRFVTQNQRSFERQTGPDRQKWKRNEDLFAGRMDWGPDREREQWMSRVFIHEFAPIVRDVATHLQNTIIERSEELVNLIPGNGASKEMAKIIENVIRYYLDQAGFYKKFYEWCLCGGIYGVAVWKQSISLDVCWKPEIIIAEIKKQQSKQTDSIKGIDENKTFVVPDSLEDIEAGLMGAADSLFGSSGKFPKPEPGPKKYTELTFNLENVNLMNFFWLPDAKDINDSQITIERTYPKFFEIEPMFESGTFEKGTNNYKLDRMLVSGSGGISSSSGQLDNYQNQKLRQRDQFNEEQGWFPRHELLEYYGPLTWTDGRIIREHCHFVVANQKVLIKNGVNEFWTKRHPYFATVFSRRPHKADGQGVADGAASIQELMNDLYSSYLDRLKMDVYGNTVINTDMLVDESQISEGMKPGGHIHVFGGKAQDAISNVPTNEYIAPNVYQALESLRLSGQKAASVNTMTANPSSRARITASEVEANDGRRMNSVNQIVTEVDLHCIEPIVENTKALVLQFALDRKNLELLKEKGVITESEFEFIAGLSPLDRFSEANKNYKLDVKGFRVVVERNQHLMRVNEWLQQVNQMDPGTKARIDMSNVLMDITDAYGFNSDRWIRGATPQDTAEEENSLLVSKPIGLGDDDDDFAHLPVHYQLLLNAGPIDFVLKHVMMHIDRLVSTGKNIPPPPPEVAQMLGLPDPKQMQEMQHLEASAGKKPLPPDRLLQ